MKSEFKTEDNLLKFKANITEKGLQIDEIIPDGKIHRFQVVNRRGKPARDGWYVYFADGCPSGAFGNWQTSEKWSWCSKNKEDLTQAEREAFKRTMADVKHQREKIEAEQHQKAKDAAIKIWETAKPVKDHPYLTKKQVAAYGLRQAGNERLIVPVLGESGDIQSHQFIDKDGEKRFLAGSKMHGGYFRIIGDPARIAICEGYATGATVHQATGYTVYIAFNCGNLEAVCKIAKKQNPAGAIIICADNDHLTPGNPGQFHGKMAAASIQAKIVTPIFSNPAKDTTDFNDLARVHGIDAVKMQIEVTTADDPGPDKEWRQEKSQASKQPAISPADLPAFTARRFMFTDPQPIRWLLRNSLQCGVVGLLVANSGVGKSFFILLLIISIILKTPLFDGVFHPETSGSVFLLAGEDSEDVIHHRLLTIVRAVYPLNEYPEAYAQACEQISQKLFVFSVAGKDFRLTKRTRENVTESLIYWELFNTLKTIDDLVLVIFDPFSRFYSENEIDAVQQTFFVSLMEKLTLEIPSRPNVLISAHANKSSGMRRGKCELVQEMIRGATGLTAAARWQIDLVLMSDEEIKRAGGDLNESYNYLWGKVVKKNVGPPEKAFALKRSAVGILSHFEIANDGGLSDDATLALIADKLSELEIEGKYKTVNTFIEAYASVFPGYGRVKLKALIEEALRTQKLFLVKRTASNGHKIDYLSATDF